MLRKAKTGNGRDRRRALGEAAEKAAARFLHGQGFRILHRNYETRLGELDIVARKRNLIVIAEVKSRTSEQFGGPEEGVSLRKQKKIVRAARFYASRFGLENLDFRFDVFAVLFDDRGRVVKIVHYPDAFAAGESF
ncbi:MAG: YraN family protein [bacterium]